MPTPLQTRALRALHGAWAWVRSVRTASDVAEADVAAMTRAELDAWTMPELPPLGGQIAMDAAGMAAQLGLTDQQLDDLFIAAAQVQT